jgi:hypothetical protein
MDILEKLRNSDLVKKIMLEDEASKLKIRKRLCGERETLRAEMEKSLPPLAETVAQAEIKMKEARENFLETERVFRNALQEKIGLGLSLSAKIDKINSKLSEEVAPEIVAAVEFFQDQIYRLPKKTENQEIRKKNKLTDVVVTFSNSNYKSVEAAVMFCRKALLILDGQKLLPEPDLEEIGVLKAGIPCLLMEEYETQSGAIVEILEDRRPGWKDAWKNPLPGGGQ